MHARLASIGFTIPSRQRSISGSALVGKVAHRPGTIANDVALPCIRIALAKLTLSPPGCPRHVKVKQRCRMQLALIITISSRGKVPNTSSLELLDATCERADSVGERLRTRLGPSRNLRIRLGEHQRRNQAYSRRELDGTRGALLGGRSCVVRRKALGRNRCIRGIDVDAIVVLGAEAQAGN